MDRFFALLSDGIHLFEGTVDKFTGDGIMALFGAPIAHEDHAQRACFAALHLNDRLAEFAAELRRTKGLNFLVRIGINSGEVVVGGIGEDLGMEYTAVGHTVGLAQRMEQLAEPGTAYLTEHTGALVQGYLALNDLGEFDVKGSSAPLRVHELTGVGSARGRLDISEARGFTRFVGRGEEMEILENAFEQAKEGKAQVIGIVGEAGVGKSRLCHEFSQRWRGQGVPVYQTSGHAHTKSIPLMPVMHLMRSYFDITEQDSDQRARERIAGKLILLDESMVEDLPLIFDFLAVPDPERPAPGMGAEARRRQLLALMKRLIRAQSADEPGINLFEDLHWIDPASEAFMANHVDAVQGTQSLTIVNFRPEYHADWMSKPYYGQIALVPLGPEHVREMLEDQLGADPSLVDLSSMLSERTGGNPFFVEEVMRSLIEDGNLEGERGAFRLVRPIKGSIVPASVQVILSARIDRLEEREKAVLRAAAVIGKEFPEPVLAEVTGLGSADLADALRALVAGGFVYEQEIYPESVYTFKHPLTQEVAYGSQLGERRAADHAAVAGAIASQYPDRLDEWAALLAQHWEAAGETLEAARWHARAAAWTGTRDPIESLRHWHLVCDLADSLPESEEVIGLRIVSRVFALQYGWRLGIAHDEAEEMFTEAERLCSKVGDLRSRALLVSVWAGYRGVTEGDMRAMAELGDQVLAIAEEAGDPGLYMSVAGVSYGSFGLGDYRKTVRLLDRAMEHGDTTMDAVTVVCPLGYCLVFKAGALASLGELAEAGELLERGIALCREEGDLETAGWGHMWSFWHRFFSGEADAALTQAQQALEVAERLGDSFSRTWAWAFFGAAQLAHGRWEEAQEALERSAQMSRERRTAVEGRGWVRSWLAEAHLGLEETDRALELAREGVEIAATGGLLPSEAFGRLVLGRVLLASGPDAAGEAGEQLAQALEICRRTGGRSLEPVIHVELAELARLGGDEATRERELQQAHRIFTEIGAAAHADRLAGDLETLTS
jgi:tetratricopeptide (TPR) repeat protein